MANRKGVESINKWKCSDGKEFTSVNEANDYQGALNELADNFDLFATEFQKDGVNLRLDTCDREDLKVLIFQWEFFKNSKTARPELFPPTRPGVSEPILGLADEPTTATAKTSFGFESDQADFSTIADDLNLQILKEDIGLGNIDNANSVPEGAPASVESGTGGHEGIIAKARESEPMSPENVAKDAADLDAIVGEFEGTGEQGKDDLGLADEPDDEKVVEYNQEPPTRAEQIAAFEHSESKKKNKGKN